MQAFFNDEKIKLKYINRVDAHIKADELVRGATGEDGKGCAVWCTLDEYNHKAYEKELGIPRWLAHVEDNLFERMPIEKSKNWPKEFLEAINVGSDLEKIKIPFLIIIVESVLNKFNHAKFPKVKESIDAVLTELRRDKLDLDKLRSARAAAYAAADAADDAADDAAYAAAYAADAADAADAAAAYAAAAAADAAADAADDAADDAAYAAAYAADAAAAAYAADAADAADAAAAYAAAAAADAAADARKTARANQYGYFADELLKLLRNAK